MREPDRINRMVEKLRIIWDAYPDLRLGQLLNYLSRDHVKFLECGPDGLGVHLHPDLWGIEDDRWEREMNREIEELHEGIRLGDQIRYLDCGLLVKKEDLYED